MAKNTKKFTAAEKEFIRHSYYNGLYSGRELAEMYDVVEHVIDGILGRL